MNRLIYILGFLLINTVVFAQPVNDDCSSATPLIIYSSEDNAISIDGDTRGAIKPDMPGLVCSGAWYEDDVWYSIDIPDILPDIGIVIKVYFDPEETTTDIPSLGMAVYRDCSIETQPILCFSDGTSTLDSMSIPSLCIENEQTIFIRVWSGLSANHHSGTFRIAAYHDSEKPPEGQDILFLEDFENGQGEWTTRIGSQNEDHEQWQWYADGTFPSFQEQRSNHILNPLSACSGIMVFTGGYYQYLRWSEIIEPPYPILEGSMTSPMIDISTTSCNALGLSMDIFYRVLNGGSRIGSGFYVRYSVDEGDTWSEVLDLAEGSSPNDIATDRRKHYLLPKAGEGESIMLQFIYDADFYFLALDNIMIYEPDPHRLILDDQSIAVPPYTQVPLSQTQEMTFMASIQNEGCNDQLNTTLSIAIQDKSNNTVFSTTSNAGVSTGGEPIENIIVPDPYRPQKRLGEYNGIYRIFSDAISETAADSIDFSYEITENTFAKDNGNNIVLDIIRLDWPDPEYESFGIFNHFYIPNGSNNGFQQFIASMSVDFQPHPDHEGEWIDLFVLDWKDSNDDGICQFDERETLFTRLLVLTGEEDGFISFPIDSILLEGDQHLLVGFEYIANDVDKIIFPVRVDTMLDYRPMIAAFDSLTNSYDDPSLRRYGSFWFNNDNLFPDYIHLNKVGSTHVLGAIRLHLTDQIVSTTETKLSDNAIKIFPSLVIDDFTIEFDLEDISQSNTISIIDVHGKVLLQQSADRIHNNILNMNIASVTSGTYMVHVQTDYGFYVERIIKQ